MNPPVHHSEPKRLQEVRQVRIERYLSLSIWYLYATLIQIPREIFTPC
jgi:hypothetical protein